MSAPKVTAAFRGFDNGVTTYVIGIGGATAHLDVRADGSVVRNHNLSAVGVVEALVAISNLKGKR